jgi:RND family efflux transporter MFP subunit
MNRARIALLFLTSLAACAHEPQLVASEAAPISVTVATVHEESFPIVYRTSGTVRGRNTAILTSKTTGYVRAVRVRAGDRVNLGQSLIDLEANDVRATVTQAHAGIEQAMEAKAEAENALQAAHVAADVAKSSFDRAQKLFDDKAIPEQQFDDAEARFRGAAAQEQMAQARVRGVASRIDEAKAVLDESQVMMGYAAIVAPFAGRVIERRVDPGVLAAPGTPLLVIADEGTPRVETAVEESRANDVKIGDDATVEIETLAAPVAGTVGEIVPTVDVASREFLVKIDLPPDVGALRAGTFARVSFASGTRPRLVVPATAISSFGALDRVFVVSDGHARLRMITHGDTVGTWTEILSGLAANEIVVAAPPSDLRDGAPVKANP